MKTIYDFGAHNGDNIPYYLLKADLVVAVEANPAMADIIRNRFREEIQRNRLVVLSVGLDVGSNGATIPFFIHKSNSVLSQIARPRPEESPDFLEIQVPARAPSDIIREFGDPWYVKIDLERADLDCLRDLMKNMIRPEYISVECHSFAVFSALVSLGGYDCFKLVDGASVGARYSSWAIRTPEGTQSISFPMHSAGPFGEDLPGEWLSGESMFYYLASEGCGWRDVHAWSGSTGTDRFVPIRYSDLSVRQSLRTLVKAIARSIGRRFGIKLNKNSV